MAENNEILNGIDEIREFYDPFMSEYKFRKEVLPDLLPACIFTRDYRNTSRSTKNIPKYYTYKALILSYKLRLLSDKQTPRG